MLIFAPTGQKNPCYKSRNGASVRGRHNYNTHHKKTLLKEGNELTNWPLGNFCSSTGQRLLDIGRRGSGSSVRSQCSADVDRSDKVVGLHYQVGKSYPRSKSQSVVSQLDSSTCTSQKWERGECNVISHHAWLRSLPKLIRGKLSKDRLLKPYRNTKNLDLTLKNSHVGKRMRVRQSCTKTELKNNTDVKASDKRKMITKILPCRAWMKRPVLYGQSFCRNTGVIFTNGRMSAFITWKYTPF